MADDDWAGNSGNQNDNSGGGSVQGGSINPLTSSERKTSLGEVVKNNITSLGHGLARALHMSVAAPDSKVANTTMGARAPAAGTPQHVAAHQSWSMPGAGISSHTIGAPHAPVSHPGTKSPNTQTPMKAAVGNRGHATTHPPTPATAHTSPDRHTRPQHATSKATGGTQHTHSSGSKAGAQTHGTHGTHPKGGSKGKKSKSKGKKK